MKSDKNWWIAEIERIFFDQVGFGKIDQQLVFNFFLVKLDLTSKIHIHKSPVDQKKFPHIKNRPPTLTTEINSKLIDQFICHRVNGL